ncbi:hypothetical protein AC1031_004910 [Aphanomyces cochlioides]|nr:hypothetical protein AC1031_004910 [Aphanomyces cochlioides]
MLVVDIDDQKQVGHLKDAIKEKKMYDFPADQLTLYVAKKDGNWLKSEDPDVMVLENGEIPTTINDIMTKENKMLPGQFVSNSKFSFPDGGAAEEDDIHVLVKFPGAGSASKTATVTHLVREIHGQDMKTRYKRIAHSRMKASDYKSLKQVFNIHVDVMRTVHLTAGKFSLTEAFQWGSICDESGKTIAITEEQQRERYRAYVEDNIGDVLTNNKLCVVGVEKGQDILTVRLRSHRIELAGRTDLLILSDLVKENPSDLQHLPEVKMLIEVKRRVKPSDDSQALSELIALELLTEHPVMALLTDLSNNWQFFWVSGINKTGVRFSKATVKAPGQAFHLIRLIIARPKFADAEIMDESFEAPLKRRKLQVPPSVSECVESDESGNIVLL